MDSRRIQYIDAIRGWAIFIVVWVHSTWLMLGASRCWMYSFAVIYPMPLFFFVSGYLRGGKVSDVRSSVVRWMRLLMLLIAGSACYALIAGMPLPEMFTDKYYYWFFTALLLCEIISYIFSRLFRGDRLIWYGSVAAALCWLLFMGTCAQWGANRFAVPWGDMEQYWLFYWLGVLMAHSKRLKDILVNKWAALAGGIILAASVYAWQSAGTLPGLLGGLGGITFTVTLFRRFDGHLPVVAWMGRRSLGIFLLSYPVLYLFRLPDMTIPESWVQTQWQWLTAFVVAVPLSLIMALVAEGAARIWKLMLLKRNNW